MTLNLTEHFTLAEATHTSHPIRNVPSAEVVVVLRATAAKMELVRSCLDNQPIRINSWYRCPELNSLVGSKPTSDHIRGAAVDFVCPNFGSTLEVCRRIIANQDLLGFKQLILEHGWVHISFDPNPLTQPKLQVLSLLQSGSYAVGLTDPKGRYYSSL